MFTPCFYPLFSFYDVHAKFVYMITLVGGQKNFCLASVWAVGISIGQKKEDYTVQFNGILKKKDHIMITILACGKAWHPFN